LNQPDPAPPQNETPPSIEAVLTRVRLIWVAMLVAPVTLLILRLALPQAGGTMSTQLVMTVAMGFLLVALPLGYLGRISIFKRGLQRDGSVAPRAFVTGSIVVFATVEAAALVGFIGSWLTPQPIPVIIPGLLALFAHLLNFPTEARLMPRPQQPLDNLSAKR